MFKLRLHLNGAEVKTIMLEPGNAYTAGRSSSCEIQLGDHPGISRQHFKLYEEGGIWRLQVVSKFGEVISNGETVTDI